MKNICSIVQSYYEFDNRVRRKVKALVAAGFSVDVLALHSPGATKTYTLDGANVRTISLGKRRGSMARYAFEYVVFFLWVLGRLTVQMLRRRYAFIDVNTLPDFLVFASAFAKWMGAKVILDMHEITPEFYMSKYGIAKESWWVRFLKYQEKISIQFADHVITVSEPIQDLLVTRGLSKAKSTVIMNSVDETRFAPSAKRSVAPDRTKVAGAFVMMYHGTLTKIYGLDIAIEAFNVAQKEMPGAEFWILGSGPEAPSLTALVEQYALTAKVRLVGNVMPADIPGWLSECDIGILPTRSDIFLEFTSPNKLSELIVMGKAVIVSRLKAIRHYFSEDALIYFEPNNPSDLAKQMVRVYRDSKLRSRLAARAKEEYAPIRWDVMRERYLRMIADITNLRHRTPEDSRAPEKRVFQNEPRIEAPDSVHTANRISLDGAKVVARKLLTYCRDNDWAGYDPYDALNSRAFMAVPFLNFKLPRLVLTQVLKRSPINFRHLLRVPKKQNPKAIGLFLSAILKLSKIGVANEEGLVELMIEQLIALRSRDLPYWCWGYSFPWQTRTKIVPIGAPNLVCTTFAAGALLDAYEQSNDSRCLAMAVSAAEYILNELYWTDGSTLAGFSYPLPSMRNQVHNANLLAAALLCRVYKHTGEDKFLGPALQAARYSAGMQHVDGSWYYGETSSQRWIDNFHTGYNLCALRCICRDLDTTEFASCIRLGYEFYRSHFFRADGAARYFHTRTYPIDIHSIAQSIITLLAFRDLDPGNEVLVYSVLGWAINHMWDDQGFFYYRVLRSCTIRTSYMRWSQAWMLLALSSFLCESGIEVKHSRTFNASTVA
jgi:glycosyltransferase involved in cell wall biosynthesis